MHTLQVLQHVPMGLIILTVTTGITDMSVQSIRVSHNDCGQSFYCHTRSFPEHLHYYSQRAEIPVTCVVINTSFSSLGVVVYVRSFNNPQHHNHNASSCSSSITVPSILYLPYFQPDFSMSTASKYCSNYRCMLSLTRKLSQCQPYLGVL